MFKIEYSELDKLNTKTHNAVCISIKGVTYCYVVNYYCGTSYSQTCRHAIKFVSLKII